MTGFVKMLNSERGFGFIKTVGIDYFFHRSECKEFDQLRVGDRVAFEKDASDRGPRAAKIRRAAMNHGDTADVESANA